MPSIKTAFRTTNGEFYDNIHHIDFKNREDLRELRGQFINETIIDSKSILGGSQTNTTGVYIYESLLDEKIAFRIYKDWANNIFCDIEQHPLDAKMISNLIKKQEQIKLTDFPIGIITLNGKVIGQEIPLYKNSCSLSENLSNLSKEQIIEKYIEILNIFKELIINEIVYSDVHSRNFILVNDVLKLIDFDPHHMSFDLSQYNSMIRNLILMINGINEYKGINFELKKERSLENIEETIMTKVLK